jgi:RNA polymerase sigma factor (sigma-70 family)
LACVNSIYFIEENKGGVTLTSKDKKSNEDIERMFDSYIKSTIRKARFDYDRKIRNQKKREIFLEDIEADIHVPGPESLEPELEDILFDNVDLNVTILQFENSMSNELLLEAFRSLSIRQKEVFFLRCLLKNAVPLISKKLGISETQVKKLNNRAFQKVTGHFNCCERSYRHYDKNQARNC